jgi:hypothetical protein
VAPDLLVARAGALDLDRVEACGQVQLHAAAAGPAHLVVAVEHRYLGVGGGVAVRTGLDLDREGELLRS